VVIRSQLLDQIREQIPAAAPLFSGSSYPMRLTALLYDRTGNRKSNMAAAKTDQNGSTYNSAHRPVRNTVSTAKPMFLGFPSSIESNAMLCEKVYLELNGRPGPMGIGRVKTTPMFTSYLTHSG
jgi:hypothetical protein